MDPRLLGKHCWVCSEPLVDNLGDRRLESWQTGVVRSCILMLDGRHIDITTHGDCVLELNELWKLLIEAENEEYARTTTSEEAHLMQLKLLCPPLGILGVRPFYGE